MSTSHNALHGLPYWLDFDRPRFPALDGDRSADAAIIGGGIAGLKTARCLARSGMKVVVLEGARVGDGASARNQGTINHSSSMSYRECVESYSRATARALWQLGIENHQSLRAEIEECSIDCGYTVGGMTLLVRRDIEGFAARWADLQTDGKLLREDGFIVEMLDEQQARERGGSAVYVGGLCYPTDAQFHSGRFVAGLAAAVSRCAGVDLFEGCRVRAIERQGKISRVRTSSGVVSAPVVVLATNALVPQFVPGLTRAMRAERGQVLVTEPLPYRPCRGSFGTSLAWWRELPEPDGKYRLLFGGARWRDEPDSLFPQYQPGGTPHPRLESEGFSPSPEHQKRLDAQLALLFPQVAGARIDYRWGGLQSFTGDDLPIVGLLDGERNIWGMGGFCGRGNCYSNVGAEYLAARITGAPNRVLEHFGSLIETAMQPGRQTANWGFWRGLFGSEADALG